MAHPPSQFKMSHSIAQTPPPQKKNYERQCKKNYVKTSKNIESSKLPWQSPHDFRQY